MTPFVWGLLIGFLGFHFVYFVGFAIVWYLKIHKSGDIPEQVQDDFTRVRESLRRKNAARN